MRLHVRRPNECIGGRAARARGEGAREDGGERCHPAVLQMYM